MTGADGVTPSDPLHQPGSAETFWTTVNAEENLAGVVDPLSGTFWLRPVSVAALGAFADMGVVPERAVVHHAEDPDRCVTSLICGRYCVNVDFLRSMADSMPGTSGDAMERDLFGEARPGIPSQRSSARYPVVALKAPGAALLVGRRVRRDFPVSQAWWRRTIAELAAPRVDRRLARARLREGHRHMAEYQRPHNIGTMVVQGVLEQVRSLAGAIGRPELELELTRGLGSLQEVGMLTRLWALSRGRGTVAEFVAEYGFHCPGESAISSVAWREAPLALDPVINAYATMPEERSPAALAADVARRRAEAARTLLGALPRWRRPAIRLLLAYGDTLWRLRETGKANYLHGIDVARAASRILGRELAAAGAIEVPEDVNYLTIDELAGGERRDHRDDVTFRKARREEYRSFDVPQAWAGVPERLPRAVAPADAGAEITGTPASPGVAEGVVRVVRDPAEAAFSDGEILVCRTTDPAWGTLFVLAAGVVIDIGAPSSHGAIVARELGIPCVINTRVGSTALRTGDRVRVDGGAGVVSRVPTA